MKIGIIGSGRIGGTLARHFAKVGHEVGVSNSRGAASLEGLVRSVGPRARAMSVREAVRFGEVVLLAIPWREHEALPAPDSLAGKVVIDAMNPYSAEGEPMDLGDATSSEVIARLLPGARLVKAFNTMYYHTLATEARTRAEERLALFLAGDDGEAKGLVAKLIEQIGFAPVDTGTLREGGRKQQPGSPIYNRPMSVQEAHEALARLEG